MPEAKILRERKSYYLQFILLIVQRIIRSILELFANRSLLAA